MFMFITRESYHWNAVISRTMLQNFKSLTFFFFLKLAVVLAGGGGHSNGAVAQGSQSEGDSNNTTVSLLW